jgi:nucleotide-binding universal stress UspA family protein
LRNLRIGRPHYGTGDAKGGVFPEKRIPEYEGLMIRHILIGLDGSTSATEVAIEWSKRLDAELTGVAIIDDMPNRQPGLYITYSPYKVTAYAERFALMKRQTRGFLKEFEGRCTTGGVRYSSRLETGDPVNVLLALHHDYDVTLLPMEPRFRFATQDEPDDTLTEVLRGACRPIVAVPKTVPTGEAVVVAYDAEPAAVDALESFAESGLGAGLSVSVVAVAEDRSTAGPRAEEAVRYLAAYGVKAEAHPVAATSGHEAEVLHAIAEHENARMVVMGAFTHGRAREWFHRSTTTRMLHDEHRLLYLHHHAN